MLVIRIGRRRPPAPSIAAASASIPSRLFCSANVTSRIAFAADTPIAMIAPINDCMLSVVPVIHRAMATPVMTAGIVERITSDTRTD
jgi:hypothetical protein